MSAEEKKNEDSKEAITKETPESKQEDSASIEETKSSTEAKSDTPDISELLKEMKEMTKSYKENIETLQTQLAETKKELDQFKEETKAKEPVVVKAIVKGKYDYAEKIQAMGYKTVKDYETHCREVYDRINSEYPSLDKLY